MTSDTPHEWQTVSMSDLVSISHGFAFKGEYFSERGTDALLTPGNFFEEGGFRHVGGKQHYYSASFPCSYRLRGGDLVVAMTEQADGLLGSAAIVPATGRWLHNQRVGRVSVKSPTIDTNYLYYLFNSHGYRTVIATTAAGTKVRHTSPSKLGAVTVDIPPPGQRRRIVSALSDADGLIEALERLIVKKQAIKQGMMQQLLTGKTRLPGFTAPWASFKLGDIASMGGGGTPPSGVSRFYGEGIPWVSVADMTRSSKYVRFTEKTLSEEGLVNSAARLYADGVILYAMYASIGECSIAAGEVSSSQAILGISPSSRLDHEFLYYWLSYIRPEVRKMGQQGTQSNLNAGMVRGFLLNLPCSEEQKAVARVLSAADDELDLLVVRLTKSKAIKQGMMQELLTGRTRLPVEEEAFV